MEIREALRSQYHGGLAMLGQCIERCPADLWESPNPPEGNAIRSFWRIAFHNVYFTHLYLGQNENAFEAPPAEMAVRRAEFAEMWSAPWNLEPYELPDGTAPCSPSEILAYLDYVDGLIDATVDGLDLDASESGFHWYKNITKISHQLMNLRHLQGHVGQLSELLMLRGIDVDWVSRRRNG